MDQSIEAPNEKELTYIAQMWVYAKDLAANIANEYSLKSSHVLAVLDND